MTTGKKKNGNHVDPFQLMLSRIDDDLDENEKEIIRRLKIQNKKLLQQVSSLRKQVKQHQTGKKQVTDSAGKQPKLEIRIEFLE